MGGKEVMDIKKVVKKIVETVRPDVDFEEEKNLISDGILESMDVVEIVTEIEEELGIDIPTSELLEENFKSLANMIDMCLRIIEKTKND